MLVYWRPLTEAVKREGLGERLGWLESDLFSASQGSFSRSLFPIREKSLIF